MREPADDVPAEGGDPDPADPWARQAQTFPRLSEEMVERVSRYGEIEALAPHAEVFSRGDRGRDFFVLLEGTIEVYERDDDGSVRPVRSQLAREFTGELDLFNDRAILVNGRAGPEPARVVRIKRADFRRMVQSEPDIAEIIMRAFILRRVGLLRHGQGAAVLIGPAHSADTLRLQQFLNRNAYPLRLFDTEQDADAGGFLECFSLSAAELPVIVLPGHRALRNPTLAELADALGITEDFDHSMVFDLAVVGAGPAGLAAAVYGASEGLQTIVLESIAPGGQAGTSSKIENYLGFPTGISGQALAGRAQVQAQKFGARLAVSRAVTALDCDDEPYRLALDDGASIRARAIVIATGARYRKLAVPGFERFEGQGIYYAATAMEANLCRAAEVIVVGGGNSAGQAAVFLSRSARHVHVLVRGAGLAATMSDYLVQRIDRSAQISLHTHSEIVGLEGESALSAVTWRHRQSGIETRRPVSAVFAMIGAEPNTAWVQGCLELDAQGFVVTGDHAGHGADSPYATSRSGVYAVGDVRSGSVKRVASGVGEGSVVVQAVHRFLHPPGV
ncbi:MAG TPA: FAD-dependent oxidoreductase [Caldimonas sp.]|jgi:thioredoxin reductase (NADPH)